MTPVAAQVALRFLCVNFGRRACLRGLLRARCGVRGRRSDWDYWDRRTLVEFLIAGEGCRVAVKLRRVSAVRVVLEDDNGLAVGCDAYAVSNDVNLDVVAAGVVGVLVAAGVSMFDRSP